MPNNTDGSIIIGVDLSLSQAEKQLRKFEGKVEETEEKIRDITSKRDQASQDGVFQAGVLDEEKAKLEELKQKLREARAIASDKSVGVSTRQEVKAGIPNIQQQIAEQQERVRLLQAEWNKTQNEVTKYDNQLQNANLELDQNKAKAGELAAKIYQANKPAEKFKRHMEDAGNGVDKVGNRLKRLMSRVLVFSVFTMAFRSVRTWMVNVIKTNDQATQAMAKLKGALLTLVQPLVNIVIPAFISFIQILTKAALVVAQIVSSLFGTTIEDSAKAAENLKAEQDALNGVGKAAKNAGKQLASFDEINQIQDTSATGGTSTVAEIVPDFSFMDGLDERLEEIAKSVTFIGTGFALWKIGSALPGMLGTIGTNLGLVMVAIGGIVLAWDGLKDAWENGVDWINMAEMIGGVAIAATALYLAFGPVVAGIALVVGGIAMLVTGFHDAMENGWNLQNTLLAVAGLFATGLGIGLVASSIIPALIGAIAGLLLAITVATGHGEELIGGIKKILEGFVEFFTGIFTGNIEMAIGGIGKIFDGLKETVGAIISGIKDFFLGFLDWLDEKTGGRFHGIIEVAKGFVTTFFDEIGTALGGFIDGIKQVFEGLIKFFTGVFTMDFDMAWEGIKDIFKGVWNGIVSIVEGAINLIVDGINFLLKKLNGLSFDVPDWIPFIGGNKWGFNIPTIPKASIPRLAQGAVIPPNREFMAVLGDQKHGTNIEAPADLIRQMVAEGMRAAGNGSRDLTVILQLDRRELGRTVYTLNNEETQRVGVRLASGVKV